ncbi:MAG: hotdog domain-containing protein [Nitrososphaeria archaeon]
MDEIETHKHIETRYSGRCIDLIPGKRSIVMLDTQEFMKTDEKGLLHGGFTFSLADYAAMVAVNHTYVVLAEALVSFVLPVKVGARLIAKAHVYRHVKNKYFVKVDVQVDDKTVFVGSFKCLVPTHHVLDVTR